MAAIQFDATVLFEEPGELETALASAMHEAGMHSGEQITAVVTANPLPGYGSDSTAMLFTFPDSWEHFDYPFSFRGADWIATGYTPEELAVKLRHRAGV